MVRMKQGIFKITFSGINVLRLNAGIFHFTSDYSFILQVNIFVNPVLQSDYPSLSPATLEQ
jgi:hypothetical protein